MRRAFLQFVLCVSLCSTSVLCFSQKCLLVKESSSVCDSLGNRLNDNEPSINSFHYDKEGRVDTTISANHLFCYWFYKPDTVITKENRGATENVSILVINKSGYIQQMQYKSYIYTDTTHRWVIDSNISIYNCLYDDEWHLVEMSSTGSKPYSNTKFKFIWKNGNKLYDEMYTGNNKLSRRQIYEYYDDKPFQDLSAEPVSTGIRTKNLIKSVSVEFNKKITMKTSYTYECNSNGLIRKRKEHSQGYITISEYSYECR